jgi:hypothetical protein
MHQGNGFWKAGTQEYNAETADFSLCMVDATVKPFHMERAGAGSSQHGLKPVSTLEGFGYVGFVDRTPGGSVLDIYPHRS